VENIVETFSLGKRFSRAQSYRALWRFQRKEDLTAVDSVSLSIRAGELFGLLGANGAGKTTLVKMLCTLVLPSAGRALVGGKDVVAEAAAVRRQIGLVDCQERSFFWRLSGRQNLRFFAALYGLPSNAADARVAEALGLVGLSDRADDRFMGYSSGMRQKLAVARGLLTMPRVLFMDEPTRSLDPVSAQELRRLVRETLVTELGCTVVLVTHRLEEAEELCERVAIMNRGRVIACGPIAEIKQRIAARQRYHLRVQQLDPTVLDNLHALPGVVQVDWAMGNPHGLHVDLVLEDENVALSPVMRYILAQGGEIQHCQVESLSLEEAFVQLVRSDTGGF
jgi:ABC-2 type transport system ATP-binding protein